ncbi:hypothetical protein WJX74_006069 [Apatococcus lobatus]|uniref:Uncharacterized protein n=1 Tax=Apatococcus lobatus TaxID=904363 RepID=A0AAW1QUA4_9CHLO
MAHRRLNFAHQEQAEAKQPSPARRPNLLVTTSRVQNPLFAASAGSNTHLQQAQESLGQDTVPGTELSKWPVRQPAQASSLQSHFTLRHPEGRHQSFLSLAEDSMLGGDNLPTRAEFSMQQNENAQQDDEAQEIQLLVTRPDASHPPTMQGHASLAGKVHLPFAMANKRRKPWPLAPRQALLSLQGVHPAEAAGLYTEPVPPGFESSIVKMEQRLAWSAALETCRDAAWKLAHLPSGARQVLLGRLFGSSADAAADLLQDWTQSGAAPWFDADGLLVLTPPALKWDVEVAPQLASLGQDGGYHVPGASTRSSRRAAAAADALMQPAYQLDVCLPRLRLSSHPLMPLEVWLAGRLLDAYDEYKSRRRLGSLSLLATQKFALEMSLQQLQQQRMEIGSSSGAASLSAQCTALEAQVHDVQIEKRVDAMRQARQESAEEVDELQQLYADLQNQRQAQGYDLTHHSLRIGQPAADYQTEEESMPTAEVLIGPLDLAPPSEAALREKKGLRKMLLTKIYTVLLINGYIVGRSQPQPVQPDFSISLQSLVSVGMVHWPETVVVRVIQQACPRDRMLGEVALSVPGVCGRPAADPAPQVLPWQGQPESSFKPLWRRKGGLDEQGTQASTVESPAPTASVPAGVLLAVCAWRGRFGNIQHSESSGPAGLTSSINPEATECQRLAAKIMPDPPPAVHEQEDVSSRRKHMVAEHDPMDPQHPPDHILDPHQATAPGAAAPVQRILAVRQPNMESSQSPARLQKHASSAIIRAAEKENAWEGTLGASGVFRLAPHPDARLEGNRVALKRSAFLKKRWEGGPQWKGVEAAGGRPRLVAPLSWRDTVDHSLLDSTPLSDASIASRRLGQAWLDRQVRAVQWQLGALAGPLERREQAIKAFALKVLDTMAHGQPSTGSGKRLCLEDIVRDVPVPMCGHKPAPQEMAGSLTASHATVSVLILGAGSLPQRVPCRRLSDDWQNAAVPLPGTPPLRTMYSSKGLPQDAQIKSKATVNARSPYYASSAAGQPQPQVAAPPWRQTWEEPVLEPFAEACLQGSVSRTAAVLGSKPAWQEHLHLPYSPTAAGTMTSSVLAEAPDMLVINVFDEVCETAEDVHRRRAMAARDRLCRLPRIHRLTTLTAADALDQQADNESPMREMHLLGSVHVPVRAIHRFGVIESDLQLSEPLVMLGYRSDADGQRPWVRLRLTMQPVIPLPPPPLPLKASGEHPDIVAHAHRWTKGLVQKLGKHAAASIWPLALEPSGAAALLTRFLAPAASPPGLAAGSDAVTMAQSAHFVALLPLSDPRIIRQVGVVNTSVSALAMASGGRMEHALLLAGYFMEAGHQAYVVRGMDLSGQDAAWVLTAGMPAAASLHSQYQDQSDDLRYDAGEMWDDEQSQHDGTESFLHASPGRISSRVSMHSPRRSPLTRSPRQQHQKQHQQQALSPMHKRNVQFSSLPSKAQVPDRSFSRPLVAAVGRGSRGIDDRSPLERGMSRGMLSHQGSRALTLQPQGSRDLRGQMSGAAGLVRGRSRGLGSKERLWEAAEGSGTWPLRDAQGQDLTPGPAELLKDMAGPASDPLDLLILWDPLTGHPHSVTQHTMHLHQVTCIFDKANLWANIQSKRSPWLMSWDLQNTHCWQPFFSKKFQSQHDLGTVQPDIRYKEVEGDFYEELELRVGEEIREALTRARRAVLTPTSKRLARVLKKLLTALPAHQIAQAALTCSGTALCGAMEGGPAGAPNCVRLGTQLQRSHDLAISKEARTDAMAGHVMCLPLSDGFGDAIREAVINTGLHMNTDDFAKFAWAVHIERTFARCICGIWIYLAVVHDPRH